MLAFYLRLSKEDREESNRIESQRKYLYQNLYRYGFSPEMVTEYIDNGYSGKNWDRPGVIHLFQDIEQGKIQTVMVKDFSRFGRNYSGVSYCLEKKFPKAGVRFIAVNNHYDSEKETNGSLAVFQNIFDDYYSEENSQKIRRSLLQLKREGNYIAPAAPYGYQKDKENRYHLVADPEAAKVVRLIFQMRCEGKSGAEIARYLNKKGILSPSDYKRGRKGEHIWQSEVVWQVVRNREYLGNLVAGKYGTVVVGGRKRRLLPKAQWIERKGVHEAIVEEEIFALAQMTGRQIGKRKVQGGREEKKRRSYLKGLVNCGGCGHRMRRKGTSFFCKYYYDNPNEFCLKEGISEEFLLEVIQQIIAERLGGLDGEAAYRWYRGELQKRKVRLEKKRERRERKRMVGEYLLYERWKNGEIGEEEYCRGRGCYKGGYQGVKESGKGGGKEQKKEEFFAELLWEMIGGIFVTASGEIRVRFSFLC